MKFTPELAFDGGRVRPLTYDDADALFHLYQHPEIPGQRVLENQDNLPRMVDLSVQMAATQRGMMWAIEIDQMLVGLVSAFDWQPSLLRTLLRVDALPTLTLAQRAAALAVCMDFMASKYHVRNFGYQWIEGQDPKLQTLLVDMGFSQTAVQRGAWRTGEHSFADVIHFARLLTTDKPVAGRLGERDQQPGQNLDHPSHTQHDNGGAAQ